MKVSIIVPVYNSEKYIDDCIQSLLKQKIDKYEIIAINDGSTDKSYDILKQYEKEYENIKVYSQKNGGASKARNYGITKAKGEYLSFVDSDDLIDENMLSIMYKRAIDDNSDIVQCGYIKFGDNFNKEEILIPNFSDDPKKNYLLSHPSTCDKIFKRTLFNKQKFQLNNYYEDLNLIPTFVTIANNISIINKPLYYYRQHATSKSSVKNKFDPRLDDIFSTLENVEQKINFGNEYFNEIEYLYITHLLRTATLRFLDYKDTNKQLIQINEIMRVKFPNWKRNEYFLKSSFKLKLICKLAYSRKYFILRIIKKITKK